MDDGLAPETIQVLSSMIATPPQMNTYGSTVVIGVNVIPSVVKKRFSVPPPHPTKQMFAFFAITLPVPDSTLVIVDHVNPSSALVIIGFVPVCGPPVAIHFPAKYSTAFTYCNPDVMKVVDVKG